MDNEQLAQQLVAVRLQGDLLRAELMAMRHRAAIAVDRVEFLEDRLSEISAILSKASEEKRQLREEIAELDGQIASTLQQTNILKDELRRRNIDCGL